MNSLLFCWVRFLREMWRLFCRSFDVEIIGDKWLMSEDCPVRIFLKSGTSNFWQIEKLWMNLTIQIVMACLSSLWTITCTMKALLYSFVVSIGSLVTYTHGVCSICPDGVDDGLLDADPTGDGSNTCAEIEILWALLQLPCYVSAETCFFCLILFLSLRLKKVFKALIDSHVWLKSPGWCQIVVLLNFRHMPWTMFVDGAPTVFQMSIRKSQIFLVHQIQLVSITWSCRYYLCVNEGIESLSSSSPFCLLDQSFIYRRLGWLQLFRSRCKRLLPRWRRSSIQMRVLLSRIGFSGTRSWRWWFQLHGTSVIVRLFTKACW